MSRRGAVFFVPLLLVCSWMWLRSGSSGGGHGGGGQRQLHCFFLLDNTGSMNRLSSAVMTGFNEFVTHQQRQPGAMKMTLAQFNSEAPFELRFEARDVHSVAPLSSFTPSGQTPLYDALAMLIDHALKVERETERDVVIAVFTDGEENASRRYKREQVFRMIEQRRKQGWTFVFLGANQDSFGSASALGMSRHSTSNYVADARGVRASWSDLSHSTLRARKVLRSGRARTESERDEYLKGFDSAEQDFQRRGGRGLAHAAAPGRGHGYGQHGHGHGGRGRHGWSRRTGSHVD